MRGLYKKDERRMSGFFREIFNQCKSLICLLGNGMFHRVTGRSRAAKGFNITRVRSARGPSGRGAGGTVAERQ